MDLNTASQRALAAVPVIGVDGAQAIISARPFTRIDDLNRLTGISAERLEQIRTRVLVSPETIPPRAIKEALSPKPTRKPAHASTLTDINTASYETLVALPSVGPETAKAIMAARPFKQLDELNQLQGLSAERLEQMRSHFIITTVPREKVQPAASDEKRRAEPKPRPTP